MGIGAGFSSEVETMSEVREWATTIFTTTIQTTSVEVDQGGVSWRLCRRMVGWRVGSGSKHGLGGGGKECLPAVRVRLQW